MADKFGHEGINNTRTDTVAFVICSVSLWIYENQHLKCSDADKINEMEIEVVSS